MSIGERLKQWRKENKISTVDISEKTGISTSVLSEYENNKKAIGSKNLLLLYEAYNIDLNWLLTGAKNENFLSDEEFQIIQYFRLCDRKTREQIIKFIMFCYNNQEDSDIQKPTTS